MNLFEVLSRESQARQLPFLVIGGHAIIAHGYQRTTSDLDLLVRESDRTAWMELVKHISYGVVNDQEAFIQFEPPSLVYWPLDLMLVDDNTFARMMSESMEITISHTQVRIPSAEHVIALKLHALKQGLQHRELGDLNDVIQLIDVAGIDTGSERFRQLCAKHGTVELYERIIRKRPLA